jgi:hypothetical protein
MYEWRDLVAAVVGGVIGSLAGGIPAYFLARRASKEVLKRDEEQRRAEEKVSAVRLFSKLSVVANSLLSLNQQVEEMLASRTVSPQDAAPTQRRLSAIVGFSAEMEMRFDAEDLAILVAAKRVEYLGEVQLLGRRHAALFDSLQVYRERKERFADLIASVGSHEVASDGLVTSKIPAELSSRIKVEEATLESLAVAIVANLSRDCELAQGVTRKFGPAMYSHFGDQTVPFFVE